MNSALSIKQCSILFILAFAVRAIVFQWAIAPHNFFNQPDSPDYHLCAVSLATGNGMQRIDTKEPYFWRTPGYPPYLALFYYYFGLDSIHFKANKAAQIASIWLQIILASFIPIILFYLAFLITQSSGISFTVAYASVVHPGLVLASTYLLTEGLALIFFYLFLLALFALFFYRSKQPVLLVFAAAVFLSIYTWMRPMGEFVGYLSTILILFGGAAARYKKNAQHALLFICLFMLSLAPWYWRNYKLTGEVFFCPTVGNYLNVFTVPKILRTVTGKPLLECHSLVQQQAAMAVAQKRRALFGTGKCVSPADTKVVAYPVVAAHPFLFAKEWIQEVLKTTFDLYSYQIIPMLDDTYWYDPLEEWLPDKIADCLYAHSMPLGVRILCWLEFICSLIVWIGLLGGFWLFVLRALYDRFAPRITKLWLLSIPLIGFILGMTGGFGYARLRLPAEPLLLLLSLTFWHWFILQRKE